MTDMQEEALRYRSQGGNETLPAEMQERLGEVRDLQLERAIDVLRGLDLYTKRSGPGDRVSAKRAALDTPTN
jgi:hypothetical protein